MDSYPEYHCAFGSDLKNATWEKKYHWEVNLDKYLPMEGTQEYSEIKFRHPIGIRSLDYGIGSLYGTLGRECRRVSNRHLSDQSRVI